MIRYLFSILVSLTLTIQSLAVEDKDVFSICAKDIKSDAVKTELKSQVRYAFVPYGDPEVSEKIQNYHNNALSRRNRIAKVEVVPNSNGQIFRIYLQNYSWNHDVWEQLADADPHYHIKLLINQDKGAYWPGGYWTDRKERCNVGWYKTDKQTITAISPWLVETKEQQDSIQTLITLTGSSIPVVRGDWFVWQTASQADKKPGYYDFFGVKNKADFDKLVGYNAKVASDANAFEALEVVTESTVTLQPRRIGAYPSIHGPFWQTSDNKQAINANNPMRFVNGGFKFDAQEVFGHLPNHIYAWGLFDAKGERQDVAPDFIASDATSHSTDRRVHVHLSCVRCHGFHDGVQPINGFFKNLIKDTPSLIQSPILASALEFQEKYIRDLDGYIEESRRKYARAIKEATDWEVVQLAKEYKNFYARYDNPVTLEEAATDVGLSQEEFVLRLKKALIELGQLDIVTAAYLGNHKKVPRIQYNEQFPLMVLALKGYVPIPGDATTVQLPVQVQVEEKVIKKPTDTSSQRQPQELGGKAAVQINKPSGSRVFIDNVEWTGVGPYLTARLEAGKRYFLDINVNGVTKQVIVEANTKTIVDFK